MITIDNFKVGEDSPDRIMFNKYYSVGRFNFHDWVINPNCEIEIDTEGKTLTIKKFVANAYVIKSKESDTSNTHIASMLNGWTCTLSGVNALVEDGTITAYEHSTWGGPTYYGWGVSVMPINADNASYSTMWPWDLGIPNGNLKNPNRGWANYGYTVDASVNLFNITSFPNNSYTVWQAGVFMLTGTYEAGTVVDISDRPIVISQNSEGGTDITNVECWDVYRGDTQLYHKDRTVENCWKQYELATEADGETNVTDTTAGAVFKHLVVDNTSGEEPAGGIKVPTVTDLEDYIESDKSDCIQFRMKLQNTEIWDKVKEWYANHDITYFWNHTSAAIFKQSDISGEITLNYNVQNEDGNPHPFMYARDNFYYCNIEKVNLISKNGCRFSSPQEFFRGATKLTEITFENQGGTDDSLFDCTDISGLFEFCGALTTYPNKLINWSRRYNTGTSIMSTHSPYAFEYTGLTEIPSYNEENRLADDNTIRTAYNILQMFNGSNSLTKIGPRLDLRMALPSQATNAFNCQKLEDARIYGLNHGDWSFDNVTRNGVWIGYLPLLNQESVEYLFANLSDLTTSDPTVHGENVYTTFRNWTTNYRHVDTNYNSDWVITVEHTLAHVKDRSGITIASTAEMFDEMSIRVSGMQEGDTLYFGDTVIAESDGDYTFTKTTDTRDALKLIGDTTLTDVVTITILHAWDDTNPRVSTAGLYCPSEWSDKITSDMISAANTKGWTIYVGGTEQIVE